MTAFLRLFYLYILRDLAQRPVRTILTVTGIGLGIAVVAAVQLSSSQAVASFTDSIDLLSGNADFQIAANGLSLDETLLEKLSWLWGVGSLSVVVEGRAGLPAGGSVRIYGIDLLSDAPFRQYISSDGRDLALNITQKEFLDLLVDPRKVILPETLARSLNLSNGDPLELILRESQQTFQVGALLEQKGAACAFGGNIIFMDIAAAQKALGKIGELDRIDVILNPAADRDRIVRRIEATLPPSVILRQPEDLSDQSGRMLKAFRYNLVALSYLSLIVGIILVYNTLNLSVVRRRTEIATLRAIGTSRRLVLGLFLVEAVTLGLVGALIGILLGAALSIVSDTLVSRTIETLYTGSLGSAPGQAMDFKLIASMLLLGAFLGAGSGLLPAWRATSLSPVTVLRRGFLFSGKNRRYLREATAGIVLLFVGIGLSTAGPVDGVPFWGYAAALTFIAAFGALTPLLARLLLSFLNPLFRTTRLASVRLALQGVEGGLMRIVIAVISLMVAVSLLVSITTMVGSFRKTVVFWVNQTLRADLFIKAAGAGRNDWGSPLREETVQALRTVAGIEAIDQFRGLSIDLGGYTTTLAGGDFEVLSRYGNLLFVDGRSTRQVAVGLIGQDRVIISEPLAIRRNLATGDRIDLPMPAGLVSFTIEDVYYDYSSERGLIVMDRSTYLKHFNDRGATSLAVYLEQGESPESVITRITRTLPEARLQIFRNSDLKREALRVFDQTFQVTYGLELIAVVVAVLGITNTLAALILERRGELALLRFLGADRSQIRKMTLVESGIVGLIGTVIGSLLGLVLSLLLILVINRQSFGWTIQFAPPYAFLGLALLLVLSSTVVAGLYPAAMAGRSDPIRSLRAE